MVTSAQSPQTAEVPEIAGAFGGGPTAEPAGAGADRPQVGFLLAQLGEHAAQAFAHRINALGLTPPQAGLLRMVADSPGRHQQEVARQLGMTPSRFVALVDSLESRTLIERRRNEKDRRFHALHLTPEGEEAMRRLGAVAQDHERDLCAGLDPDEHRALAALLTRVAEQQGLTPGGHPGYGRLDPDHTSR